MAGDSRPAEAGWAGVCRLSIDWFCPPAKQTNKRTQSPPITAPERTSGSGAWQGFYGSATVRMRVAHYTYAGSGAVASAFITAAIAFKHRTMQLPRMNSSQLDQSCRRTPHTHGIGSHTPSIVAIVNQPTNQWTHTLPRRTGGWDSWTARKEPTYGWEAPPAGMSQILPDLFEMLLTNCWCRKMVKNEKSELRLIFMRQTAHYVPFIYL